MDYELLANGKIQIGGEAPKFVCNSTMKQVTVSKEEKKWFVLFSYKEDFYPIASNEMIFIEKNRKSFEELGVNIIAMSTGNLLSHFAWINDIYRNTGIKINFPILDDPIGEVCRKYGMISKIDNISVVMSNVVIVDDKNIVRCIFEYSPQIERNVYEIIRVIRLLKANYELI